MNRLTGMQYHAFGGSTSWDNTTGNASGIYNERYSYDASGNILTLKRHGNKATSPLMDDLSYHYKPGTNQLDHVVDPVLPEVYANSDAKDVESQQAGNYHYDRIGNLIKDNKENISKVEWTVYGKLKSITTNRTYTSQMDFVYDALGNRVHKHELVTSSNQLIRDRKTYYVRDAQGNVLAVYQSETEFVGPIVDDFSQSLASTSPQPVPPPYRHKALARAEQHLYGSSRLGIWRPATGTGDPSRVYELTNHLGNVLAPISDQKIAVPSTGNSSLIDHYEPDVLSAQDYYPFGMQMPGRTIASGTYRYGFNGKENDREVKGVGNHVSLNDFGYDPRIGRRWRTDPAFKEYPSLSPYTGFGNNPIIFTDPDGKRIYFVPGLGYDASKGDVGNSRYARESEGVPASLAPYLQAHNTYSKTIQASNGGRINDMLYVAWHGQQPRLNLANDKRALMMINSIVADLNQNPLKPGEQMNILATSQGTVSAAQAAIAMVTDPTKYGLAEGFKIDNLILAGSPLSPKSKLYKKLAALQEEGKIGNIEYEKYQAEGDVVTGLAGTSKLGAIVRGFGYIGKILQALKQHKRGEEFTDPHIRAAENKSITPGSNKKFSDELKDKLEKDDIH